MRVVLDTSSFVTAIRSSGGAAGELIRRAFLGEVVLLMDYKLGLEYRDVALRPQHLEASGLSAEAVLEIIEAVEAFAEPVRVATSLRPMSNDPDDDMVLDLAIYGGADALVTNNTKHFAEAGGRYGIAVLTPAALLIELRRANSHAD